MEADFPVFVAVFVAIIDTPAVAPPIAVVLASIAVAVAEVPKNKHGAVGQKKYINEY